MENKLNMVIIDKDEYYELRNFKEEYLKGKFFVSKDNISPYHIEHKFYTESEAIGQLLKENELRMDIIRSNDEMISILEKQIEILRAKKQNTFVKVWKYLF